MNYRILNSEIQKFIQDHVQSDIPSLLLKGIGFEGIETTEIIAQIESKKRCQKKLPTWFNHKNIYYPSKLNIEQTSSEITAKYKASLIEGTSIIDITGGFGVDSYYFSKQFKEVFHCEINAELSEIVQYNYEQLKVKNIQTSNSDGIEFLKQLRKKVDWIYIDPSRRDDKKGKVFFLKDCSPNVPNELDLLFKYSNNIMIKTSPLLDLSVGIGELKHVKSIHVVAVNNEVKELLWILEKRYNSNIKIETINLKNNSKEVFDFNLAEESQSQASYSLPLAYLYEPNSAILKAGAFNSVASKFDICKLHKHSHLYTSDTFMQFPGRAFKVVKSVLYNKKALKGLNIQKGNITTRNFPETVQQIRSTLKIQDGGIVYLFFTTNMHNEKCVLICTKVELVD